MLIVFQWQQWLSERVSILRYTTCPVLFIFVRPQQAPEPPPPSCSVGERDQRKHGCKHRCYCHNIFSENY